MQNLLLLDCSEVFRLLDYSLNRREPLDLCVLKKAALH